MVELAELLTALIRANLAAGAVILLVVALRDRARNLFGAEVAYGLWLAPLAAGLASLIPARTLMVAATTAPHAADPIKTLLATVGHADILVCLWAAGLLAVAGWLGVSQLRFLHRAKLGLAGPALVGVFGPRLVVPADYETRFTPEERRLIRIHERTHMDRGDLLPNALIAGLQAVCWFNPLVHWAAKLMRQDQELACDAAVVARLPGVRRRYAETLLKTQLAPTPLPLGCYWPAPSRHPLEERIGLLHQTTPQVRRHMAGSLSVLALTLVVGGGAWALKPAHLAPLPVVVKPSEKPQPVMSFQLYRKGWPAA